MAEQKTIGQKEQAYIGKQGISLGNYFVVDSTGVGFLNGLIFADISEKEGTPLENNIIQTDIDKAWFLNKDVFQYQDSEFDSDEKKYGNSKIKLQQSNFKTHISPNRIYLASSGESNSAGSIYISPGAGKKGYQDEGVPRKGHFYFTLPICTSNIRLGSDGIRYIYQTSVEVDSKNKKNERYFYLGPNRTDVNANFDAKPTLSILRGKHLTLQAYGADKEDKYIGEIRLKAKNTILLNNSYLKGINSGGDTSIIAFLDKARSDKYHVNGTPGTAKDCTHRLVIGAASNPGQLELRSGKGVLIKTKGTITDGKNYSSRVFQFATLNFGTSKKEKYRGCFRPMNDGFARLGSASQRWYKVFASSGLSQTSDKRLKTNIEDLDSSYVKFFDLLKPVRFKWKNSDEKNFKTGFIAQDVEIALYKAGLTNQDFAGLEKEFDENNSNNYIYGLNYSDFIAPMTAKIKQLEKIIEQQQQQINQLLQLV